MSDYIVQRGDNLTRIANDNDMSLQELLSYNPDIRNPNLIFPGQRIRLSDDENGSDYDDDDDAQNDDDDSYNCGDDDDFDYGDEDYDDSGCQDDDDYGQNGDDNGDDDEDDDGQDDDDNNYGQDDDDQQDDDDDEDQCDDDDDDQYGADQPQGNRGGGGDDDADWEELYLDQDDVDADGQDDEDQEAEAEEEEPAGATSGLEAVFDFVMDIIGVNDAKKAYKCYQEGDVKQAVGYGLLAVVSLIPVCKGGRILVKAGANGGTILSKRVIAQVVAREGIKRPSVLIVASKISVPRNSVKHAMVARYLKYAPLSSWRNMTPGKLAKELTNLNRDFGAGQWEKVFLPVQLGKNGTQVHAFLDRSRRLLVLPKFKPF